MRRHIINPESIKSEYKKLQEGIEIKATEIVEIFPLPIPIYIRPMKVGTDTFTVYYKTYVYGNVDQTSNIWARIDAKNVEQIHIRRNRNNNKDFQSFWYKQMASLISADVDVLVWCYHNKNVREMYKELMDEAERDPYLNAIYNTLFPKKKSG